MKGERPLLPIRDDVHYLEVLAKNLGINPHYSLEQMRRYESNR